MIGWGDIYKVVEAMVPLYVALGLGYGSVRWWRIFTPEQSDAINKLVSTFTLPLFTFEFTLHVDPFAMNQRFIAADALSKAVIVGVLAVWAKCSGGKGSYGWSVTSFSLSTLTNSLVVGAPMLRAMYGPAAQDLVVQCSVVQAIVWLSLLLFVLEVREARLDVVGTKEVVVGAEEGTADASGFHHINVGIEFPSEKAAVAVTGKDEDGIGGPTKLQETVSKTRPSFLCIMKIVWLKLALNPNSYASIVGITWALVANRWHFGMPSIMEGSVVIMSKAGTGMAMFSMGLFMANQEKIISCGFGLMTYSMVLKFVAGPAAMAIGSIALGLRGDVLRIAIIQAAVPQSITSFIFAREYGLHADVLSTAVIFGMLLSMPILITYYVVLEVMH